MARYASVVLVDPKLSHLDRAFTYSIPDGWVAGVGSYVRVPFRRRRARGIVVELLAQADIERPLDLAETLGPGLPEDVVEIAGWTAGRYLSTMGEALAAAMPQRVASEESEEAASSVPRAREENHAPGRGEWLEEFRSGSNLRDTVVEGRAGSFVLRTSDTDRATWFLAELAASRGRGVIVLFPEVIASRPAASNVAWLGSDRGARERYREWLALRSGAKRVAAGGRAAVFAPVQDLGLVVVQDDWHASYKEARAPRYHARAVAAERARRAGATLVLAGAPPSIEARAACERSGFTLVARPRHDERAQRRPVVIVDEQTRLVPASKTLAMARAELEAGRRVLVLAHRTGADLERIAERTFRILRPRAPASVDASLGPAAVARAAARADCIVASPVIAMKRPPMEKLGLLALVEVDAALAQPSFRAAEEAFATWWRASDPHGGPVRIAVETRRPDHPAIVALARWDPDVLYRAEIRRRRELGYPPFASIARIDVPADRAEQAAERLRALAGVEVLGPADGGTGAVIVVRARRRDTLLSALRPVADEWRRREEPMRVDVDPWEVLVPKWRS